MRCGEIHWVRLMRRVRLSRRAHGYNEQIVILHHNSLTAVLKSSVIMSTHLQRAVLSVRIFISPRCNARDPVEYLDMNFTRKHENPRTTEHKVYTCFTHENIILGTFARPLNTWEFKSKVTSSISPIFIVNSTISSLGFRSVWTEPCHTVLCLRTRFCMRISRSLSRLFHSSDNAFMYCDSLSFNCPKKQVNYCWKGRSHCIDTATCRLYYCVPVCKPILNSHLSLRSAFSATCSKQLIASNKILRSSIKVSADRLSFFLPSKAQCAKVKVSTIFTWFSKSCSCCSFHISSSRAAWYSTVCRGSAASTGGAPGASAELV